MPTDKYKNITEVNQNPELSEKIVEFQMKEIELKTKEVELRKKEADNNYNFAKESLKFQSEDYKDIRKRETSKEKLVMTAIFISVFLFFGFLMSAMLLDKDQILTDIIKVAGYIFGGGITGYGIGLHKNKDKKPSAEN